MLRVGLMMIAAGLCLLFGLVPEGKAVACDNWCRARIQFYQCPAGGGGGCWETVFPTCWYCIGNRKCKPGSEWGWGTCTTTSTDSNGWFWNTGCSSVCGPCGTLLEVEATG
ncbi:MAG: hypothetical protein K2W96_21320, partial [Gemmataceae bacterium]|nr:hypothetical protein [Gemmataceae bacterium]